MIKTEMERGEIHFTGEMEMVCGQCGARLSLEGFMLTETGARGRAEGASSVRKIPVTRSSEGGKHRAWMENMEYFSLSRMLQLKTA